MEKLHTAFIVALLLHGIDGAGEPASSRNELNTSRYKRETCTPKVKFKLCRADSSEQNYMWNFQNSLRYTFEVIITPRCSLSEFDVEWTLLDKLTKAVRKRFKKYRDKSVLKIDPYTLDFGRYILVAHVKESAQFKMTGSATAYCWIRAVPRKPMPHIKGGSSRNVAAGSVIALDASGTIESGTKDLKYTWNCRARNPDQYCVNLKTREGKFVSIPASSTPTYRYQFTLTVKADRISESVVQTVIVATNKTPIIEVQCVKNCMETGNLYTDPKVPMYLRVICISKCEEISEYYWDCQGDSCEVGINTGTVYGRKDERLVIKIGMLRYNTNYSFTVQAKGANHRKLAVAELKIRTAVNIAEQIDCSVNPKEGWSMETDFHVKCHVPNHMGPLTYQLQQYFGEQTENEEKKQGATIAFSPIPEFAVKLSAEQGGEQLIQVIFVDDTMIYTGQALKVNVKSAISELKDDNKKLQEILKIFNGEAVGIESVKSMLKMGRTDKAIQTINILLAELKKIKDTEETEKFIADFQLTIMEGLLEDLSLGGDELKAMITLVPKLTIGQDKPKNLRHTTFKARLCKTLARGVEEHVKTIQQPFTYHRIVHDYNKYLQDCAEELLDSNFQKLKGFDVTTQPNLYGEVFISEDYPNYKDTLDESTRESYKVVTQDAIETLQSLGLAFSRTIARGEPPTIVGTKSNMSIEIDYADFITKKKYERPGVLVKLPSSLGIGKEEETRVVFTTLNNDAFFWEDSSNRLSTPIVDITIYSKDDKRVTEVPNPFDSFLDVLVSNVTQYLEGQVTVPTSPEKWISKFIDFSMAVYRIDVQNGSSFLVVFSDIRPVKEIMVVIQRFRRPSIDDFKKAKILRNNKSVRIPTLNEDCWYYVAVLPRKADALESKYQEGENKTKRNALEKPRYDKNEKVGENTSFTRVHCRCKTIATLSAQVRSMNSKLDIVRSISIKLPLVINYTVYVTTLSAFLLYCLTLCFVMLRKRLPRHLYFLSDNLNDERYAYLVIVQTGKYHLSGTTSNVIIKIHGLKTSSKAHVLNYPDPDKRILQRGKEDLFVLTAENHLGDITQIELWYDNIGYRPSWFCEAVTIFDLQTKAKWYFEVNEWFTVVKDNKYNFLINPKSEDDRVEKKDICRPVNFSFGAQHTWNVFETTHNILRTITGAHYFVRNTILHDDLSLVGVEEFVIAQARKLYDKARKSENPLIRGLGDHDVENPYSRHKHPKLLLLREPEEDARSDDLILTYIERITVILSHIFCTYAFTLWICSNPTMRLRDTIGNNYFSDYEYLIGFSLLIALLTFVPNITITMLFRHAKRVHILTQISSKALYLPERVRTVAWIILILTIGATATYLIIFGFWISYLSSLAWLTVTTIALLIDIFILENGFHMVFSGLLKMLGKYSKVEVNYNFEEIIEEAENQRKTLYGTLGNYGLRPYLNHLYRPLSQYKLTERKRREVTKSYIRRTLKDMIYFCLYIFLTFVILFINMDSMSNLSNNHMKDMLQGRLSGYLGTEKVQNLENLFDYLNDTLIDVLHPQTWYGVWGINDPGVMVDLNTKVIGVARILQKKIMKDSCALTPIIRGLNVTMCNPDYDSKYVDRTREGEDESMWSFQSAKKSGSYLIMGELSTYDGSGFIAKLGRNINNAYFMVQLLKNDNWLNCWTRVVIIEFLAYNVNTNLFNAVTILFERSATQKIVAHTTIFTGRLVYTQNKLVAFIVVAFSILVLLIFYQTVKLSVRIIKHGATYLLNFWNVLETLIAIMNIIVIVLFLYKHNESDKVLANLAKTKHSEFINYFHVIFVHNIIIILTAILIFVAILRLWKFLRFIFMFRVFERTLVTAFWPLFAVFVFNVMIALMFGLTGHILFGFCSPHYKTLNRTFVTLMQLCLNMAPGFSYDILISYFPKTGVAYYSLFLCFAYSMLNLYIITVNMHYYESRSYLSNKTFPYSIEDYLKDEWKYLSELWKRQILATRLRGGQEFRLPDNELVCPKSEVQRYAKCVVMTDNKLANMALIARGTIRNLYYLREDNILSDVELQLMKDVVLNETDHKHEKITSRTIFFKGNDEGGKVKFIPDSKLLAMEYIVRHLLTAPKDIFHETEERVIIKDQNSLERMGLIESAVDSVNKIISNINIVVKEKRRKRRT